MTIPEILTAMTILAILMTFVYQIVHPSSREIRRAEAEVETQQSTLLTLQNTVGEASLSDHRSVGVTDSTLSFLSSEPLRNTGAPPLPSTDYVDTGVRGTPQWTKFVLYYLDPAEERMLRKEFPYSQGQRVAVLSNDRLAALIADGRYPARRIAGGISSFSVRQTHPDRFNLEVTSTLSGLGELRATSLQLNFATRNTL